MSKSSEQTIRTDIQTTTQTTIRTINENYEGNRDGNEGNRDGNRKANGYKEPEFVETVDPDRITLTLEIEVRDKTAENVANNVANVATVINGYTLTESEKSVYEFIVSHVNASTKDISEATGATARTVQRSIKERQKRIGMKIR